LGNLCQQHAADSCIIRSADLVNITPITDPFLYQPTISVSLVEAGSTLKIFFIATSFEAS